MQPVEQLGRSELRGPPPVAREPVRVEYVGAGARRAAPEERGGVLHDAAARHDPLPVVAHPFEGRRPHQGNPTSTNPIASIYAWTRGLAHRGRLDKTPDVSEFAETLEDVIVKTVESGKMTKDLALLVGGDQGHLSTEEFLAALDENLSARLA